MAFSIQPQVLYCSFNHHLPKTLILPKIIPQKRQMHSIFSKKYHHSQPQPSSWSPESIEFVCNQNNPMVEAEEKTLNKMEEEIQSMLENEGMEASTLLELINDIHRLGLGYRFKGSIRKAIDRIMLLQSSQIHQIIHKNLHVCSLYFSLLRQYGYHISTDIFESFKDSNGNFATILNTDVQGMLSLYEASYLAFEEEKVLEKAKEFTKFHLENMMGKMEKKMAKRVRHALEIPFHQRMLRMEARGNIEMYDDKKNYTNQVLHKLAILDFNLVQSVHQRDFQQVLRWWKHVGLVNKLSFARERLIECFFATIGIVFEPQFSKCRIEITKALVLVTLLDDIYDFYASPEELQQLTDAVDKWDVNSVENLPDYMKLCFLALYNTANDIAYDTSKEQGQFIISHLNKVWADLCKAFLQEAKWRNSKHIPKFDEYLNNGRISSSGFIVLIYAYFMTDQTISVEAANSLHNFPNFLCYSSAIFRLANDLSSIEEDIERVGPKAISCYMHETGSSNEVARAYIRDLIDHNCKMINKEMTYNLIFDKSFIEKAYNLARTALSQYRSGDHFTAPGEEAKKRVKSLIMEPIYSTKVEI